MAEPVRNPDSGKFGPGNNANPHGRKGRAGALAAEDAEAGWSDDGATTLERMRRVFSQLPSADRGPPERELRKFLKKDSKGFVAQLISLERADANARAKGLGPGPATADGSAHTPADEPTDDLLALVGRLLEDETAAPGTHPS